MEQTTLDRPAGPPDDDQQAPSLPLRVTLASLSIAAGAIHLVMTPVHFQQGMLDGMGFALAAWAQIGVGIALLAWPRRALIAPAVAVNAAVFALWAISRTVGLPAGAHAGVVEPIGEIDGLAAAFAAGAIALGLAALARPELWANAKDQAMVVATAVPVLVLVATTLSLTSDEIGQHLHDGEAATAQGHAHEGDMALASINEERCDLGFNPVSYWQETELIGVDTVYGGAGGGDGGHDHGSASVSNMNDAPLRGRGSKHLDEIMVLMDGFGESGAAAVIAELAVAEHDVYEEWLRMLHLFQQHDHDSGAPDDNHGAGGHLGPQAWLAMTDQAECDLLAEELAQAQQVAFDNATAADAIENGYRMVTPYVPGIAAHYMNFSYVDGEFEIDKPEMLLYDGHGEDANIVGLSYYVIQPASTEPTQGFTGYNDHYHRHVGLCMRGGLVVGDTDTSAEECEAMGGRKSDGSAGWMSHAWVVPGCESPWGVFSASNPILDVALRETSGSDGGGCSGIGDLIAERYDLTPGSVETMPTDDVETTEEIASP